MVFRREGENARFVSSEQSCSFHIKRDIVEKVFRIYRVGIRNFSKRISAKRTKIFKRFKKCFVSCVDAELLK